MDQTESAADATRVIGFSTTASQSAWRVTVRLGLVAWRCLSVAAHMTAQARGSAAVEVRQRAGCVHHLATQLCRDHGIQVVVEGRVPDRPAILVANHVSHMDPLVIATVKPVLPIAKAEIARWPFIGWVGPYLGVMFVRRDSVMSGARVLRESLRALRQGASVLNFPEGTTTLGTDVLPFRRGIFGLAAIADVPVIPTALRFDPSGLAWVGDAYFVPHCLRAFARSRWTAYVRFGEPLYGRRTLPAEELAKASREAIARLLGTMPRTVASPDQSRGTGV
ncbi:MAG: lysophospholipid acyltransferase family protein [Gammaproteobacteria bacterium]